MILILAMLLMADSPSAQQIIERYEAAIGDPAIARAHETRVIHSRMEDLSGNESRASEYFLAPNRYLQVTLFEGGFVSRLGSDGTSVWTHSPRGIIEVLPHDKVRAVARDAIFNRHLKLREIYPAMRVVGSSTVAGRPAWQIEATTPEGDKEQMYFDAANFLLVRRTFEQTTGSGERFTKDLLYENYTDFGGLLLPAVTRQFAPYASLFRIERVDHNAELNEFAFRPPTCGEPKK